MTSENDVPKFLRFCDLQDRGLRNLTPVCGIYKSTKASRSADF